MDRCLFVKVTVRYSGTPNATHLVGSTLLPLLLRDQQSTALVPTSTTL
jgi:hypothetical protein